MQRITLNDKQKAWLFSAALSFLNIAICAFPGIRTFSFEFRPISVWLTVISAILYLLIIPICIVLRAKKKIWIARGLFFYQFYGALAYVLFFVSYVAGKGSGAFANLCSSLFRWWTLLYEPAIVTLSRVIGIPLKFTMGLFFLILIEITGNTVTAIRKDIRYEKELAEERAYEEATRGRGGRW